MNKNIILAGVGGQGILTIAAIIDHAAMQQGLFIKQAEVHGMSQRGGAVQSHLRISDEYIYSDLIPKGQADLIISLEPMEALRYMPYLSENGTIITALNIINNIADYPETNKIYDSIKNSGVNYMFVNTDDLAKDAGNPKTVNVIMIGASSPFLGISESQLRESIKEMFALKGDQIVQFNMKAFDLGLNEAKYKQLN